MCGRFSMTADDAAQIAESVARDFGLMLAAQDREELATVHRRRFNAAPGQQHWLLSAKRRPLTARWGLPDRAGRSLVNMRSENIAQAQVAGQAPTQHEAPPARCALVVSGFYEWGGSPRGPWHFRGEQPLVLLAALARRARVGPHVGEPHFAVLTRSPSPEVALVHDRMPLMLSRTSAAVWLDPSRANEHAADACLRAPASRLRGRRVGPAVNNPRIDDARCLQDDPQGRLFG